MHTSTRDWSYYCALLLTAACMRKTQIEWVKQQLQANGEISRNECLRNYISRLGAIICLLKALGYTFHTFRRDGDYVYKLGEVPKRKVTEFVPVYIDGVRHMRPVVKYV